MEVEQDTTVEIEAKVPFGSLTARGVRLVDFIILATFCGAVTAALASVYYGSESIKAIHEVAKQSLDYNARAIEADIQVAEAIRKQAIAQRMFACIISREQKDREREFSDPHSFCNRFSSD